MPTETPAEKPKHPGGRPTKCTPEVIAEFANLMAAGNYFETACDYVGLSKQTAYNWIKRGQEALAAADDLDAVPEGERIFVEFMDATHRSAAQAEVRNVALIQQAARDGAPGDWRASAWWLEKRKQDTWGEKRTKLEHTGPGGGAVQVEAWWKGIEKIQDEEQAKRDGGDGE